MTQETDTGGDDTEPPVVCSNCGKGDWSDHEPGDSLRCPFCESHNALVFESDQGGDE